MLATSPSSPTFVKMYVGKSQADWGTVDGDDIDKEEDGRFNPPDGGQADCVQMEKEYD